jgi:hypothetical protein
MTLFKTSVLLLYILALCFNSSVLQKTILQRVLPEFVKAFFTFLTFVLWFHGTDTDVMKTVVFRASVLTKLVSTKHRYVKICHRI